MPRKKQTDIEQPELIADESAEYLVSPHEETLHEGYRKRLAEMLKDPEFRKIEGFPIGEDEAILALSDPPYYTACPNPFLNEIVEKWRSERAALREELGLPNDEPAGSKYILRENMPTKNYHREPFAADVSEGKNDPIYNAHSYHTKVPHKAIIRYILHYTDPGDVVLDGFCGTGMTGVAAQLCSDKKTVESLGYSIKDGMIYDEGNKPISRLGSRKTILNDLSPAATFIAYNYNTPVDTRGFESDAKHILKEVETECGWMYETWHPNCDDPKKVKGRIRFVVWSEVFLCPNCSNEIIFFEDGLDDKTKKVKENFPCPNCSTTASKTTLDKYYVTYYDPISGQTQKTLKRQPVLIEYMVGDTKYTKKVDHEDLELLEKVNNLPLPTGFVSSELPYMHMTHQRMRIANYGVTHLHHFFLPRARQSLGFLWKKAQAISDLRLRNFMLFTVEQAIWTMSLLDRYRPTGYSQVNQYLSGVYYISSLISEVSPWYVLDGKIKRLTQAFFSLQTNNAQVITTTQSASAMPSVENIADYIFTDPPFGENIYYADLNYLVESWHGVVTNSKLEAIIDQSKHKEIGEYRDLMYRAFCQYYKWLKPGRWMTVEFHNSQNAVWNAIQESLSSAGFIVADVRTLDKQTSSYRQVTASTATKQDLIISAYKPTDEFEKRFISEAGSEQGAWDFMRQHLEQLPLPNIKDGALETLQERFPYLLYDRMVAFHIQHGLTIPLSAPEFYQGLSQRFLEREGMVFTAAQAAAYDKLRLQAERVEQLALFVRDESSARQWLRQELEREPQTYGDLQPHFVQKLRQSKYEDLPELKILLEQSFIKNEQGKWHVPDPDNAAHLEQLRQYALLREFNEYRKSKGRLKVFRSEAVRAGFSNAWRERKYKVIVEIAERMPESVLQEDQQLLMYYHNASLRQSSEPKQENLL
jgi:DNA modification methylase